MAVISVHVESATCQRDSLKRPLLKPKAKQAAEAQSTKQHCPSPEKPEIPLHADTLPNVARKSKEEPARHDNNQNRLEDEPELHDSPARSLQQHAQTDAQQLHAVASSRLQPIPHATLSGEYRIPSFVTEEEEKDLIDMLDTCAPHWKDSIFNGKHRGKRWGAEMDLGKRTVIAGATAFPTQLLMLIQRMQSIPLLAAFQPNEANAIDYQKALGHWLKPHVDDRQLSTDKIVTLSLAGPAVMTFSCSKKAHSVAVELPPCTLQVITKEARYMYTHGISKADLAGPRRLSITFRQSPLKK